MYPWGALAENVFFFNYFFFGVGQGVTEKRRVYVKTPKSLWAVSKADGKENT